MSKKSNRILIEHLNTIDPSFEINQEVTEKLAVEIEKVTEYIKKKYFMKEQDYAGLGDLGVAGLTEVSAVIDNIQSIVTVRKDGSLRVSLTIVK